MPTYEYQCFDCGKTFEAIQKITEPALDECPDCKGKNVKRLISATAFHLKGTGWYKTDYSSGSSSSSSSSSSGSTGASTNGSSEKKAEASGGSAESKPAASSSDSSSSTASSATKSETK